MSRTIVIGDLHGCYQETLELLDKLAVTSADRVIFVGDLVDRGPQPRECVELAMRHECVLGNHEETHLRIRHSRPDKLLPDHIRTRAALESAHYEYFERLPYFLRLPEYNAVVVHAGVYPGLSIEEQPHHSLLHVQCIGPNVAEPTPYKSFWPSKAPAGFTFWTNHWNGPERVIFGHTVLDRPLISKYAVGIDTGAVFGRSLSALVLPDWDVVSVPSHTSYHNRTQQSPRLYPLMAGVSTFS